MKTRKNIHHFLALGVALAVWPLVASAQTYTWSTIAGLGGTSGTNNGTGDAARFTTPAGITVDIGGNVYVADFGNDTIRKLTFDSLASNWSVVTIAGKVNANQRVDGAGTAAWFLGPAAIVSSGPNSLYVVDYEPSIAVWGKLRILTLVSGVWQTVTPSVPSLSPFGQLGQPTGIALNGAGELFVTATSQNVTTKLALQGQNWSNVPIAGDGSGYGSGFADGTNWASRFNAPSGVGVDAAGNVYVTDTGNHTVRKITPVINTTNWITTTIAGQVGNPGNTDGTNTTAQFNGPDGLATDASGNIYVSDANNNVIRKLTPQGTNWIVTTIGGQLNRSHGTNDGVGTTSSFYHPAGLAVDNLGRVFVTDYLNNTIRMGIPSAVSNPPPALQIATAGNSAFVIWPSSATGYVLQSATNLNVGPWLTVTGGITTNFVFSGPMTNAQNFYRLQQP